MASSLFVYLPSDVNSERYGGRNTAADYIVPLSKTLRLPPEWEVGLMEIIMPGCIYNIADPWDRGITVAFKKKTVNREGHVFTKHGKVEIRVRPGQYTPEKYAEYVNSVLERLEIDPPAKDKVPMKLFYGRLKYEHNTRKMAFQLRVGESISITNPVLRRMLGFTEGDPTIFRHIRKTAITSGEHYKVKEISEWEEMGEGEEEEEEEEAEVAGGGRRGRESGGGPMRHTYTDTSRRTVTTDGSVRDAVSAITTLYGGKQKQRRYRVFRPSGVCNFDINGQQLYVYADIADYDLVGETEAPVLRIIPIGTFQQGQGCFTSQHFEFKNVHYKGLRIRDIDTIHIRLCNTYGENVPFVEGVSSVVLNFREKKD